MWRLPYAISRTICSSAVKNYWLGGVYLTSFHSDAIHYCRNSHQKKKVQNRGTATVHTPIRLTTTNYYYIMFFVS